MKQHPIQPLVEDSNGVLRFKDNKIVSWMLDQGRLGNKFDMNRITIQDFSREDREQFAQLIGYSHSGASELEYVSDQVLEVAELTYKTGQTELEARNQYLQETLDTVKSKLRDGIALLYSKHPDDLLEEE